MKIKDGFILRSVSDAYVVVPLGEAAKTFNGMITLNETGAFLWKKLSESDVDEKSLVDSLLNEYDAVSYTHLNPPDGAAKRYRLVFPDLK